MLRCFVVVAVTLCLAALSCANSETPRDEGAPSQMRATPLPAATPLKAATASLPAATPARPMTRATVLPPQEPAPTPPPLPLVSIEHGGSVHYGRQGSNCWPVSANSIICGDVVWEDFDSAPTVSVKRGDELSVVVSTDESSPGEVQVQVFTVKSTEPFLRPGDEVYSSPAGDGTTLDLEPGVYFLSAFYKSGLGDVSYGFRLEMVD